MGIMDAFNPEDRVEVTFTQFYKLMEQAAEAKAKLQYIENAVVANVPNNYIRSMIDGVDYTERMDEHV